MLPRQSISLLLLATILVTLNAANHKKVPQPPQIVEHPDKEYGFRLRSAGVEVRLPCRARGEPAPLYHWKKDGRRLVMKPNIKRFPADGSIIIKEPQEDDQGIYQCFAENDYGTAVSSTANLRRAFLDPFNPSRTRLHTPEVGAYLMLRCSPPASYPTGHIYWSRGVSDSQQTSNRVKVDTNDRVTVDYEGNLHFENIVSNDTNDRYVCAIYNQRIKGTMEGEIQRVKVRPNDQGNLHFANVMEIDGKDEDTYSCTVENHRIRGFVQGNDQKIQPSRQSATPQFLAPRLRWKTDSPTVAIVGQSHKMKCIFSGYPTPRVTWTRLGGKSLPASHVMNDAGMELVINKTRWEDAGEYRCQAITPDMPNAIPVHRDFTLVVESPPYFTKQMKDVIASEEENAEFECDVSGVPAPSITWTINGVKIGDLDAEPRRTVRGDKVLYVNLTKADSQVLQCNASNKHGYAFANAYLNVLAEAPMFLTSPEAVLKVAEGQNVNLTCRVFGHPRPKISWFKEKEEVSDPRMSIRPDDPGSTNGGNLTIQGVLKSDEGVYTCQAVNKFGNESESGRLIVRGRTVISKPPEDKTVNASTDVTLECEATTDPAEAVQLKITWLRNGQPIDYENERRVSKNNRDNSLLIRGATVNDTAEYTCVADNGLDSDEQSVQVTVKDRPDPPQNVRLRSCTMSAEVEWEPGRENNEDVIEFIIYYNTSFDEPGTFHKAKTVSRGTTSARIILSAWTNYTFHVIARNNLGVSDRSNFSPSRCTTPEDTPKKNPENVCTASREADQLVITWDPMPKIDHNGEGFYYEVNWRLLDTSNMPANAVKITDWQTGEYVVGGTDTFKEYEIFVRANNNQGPSPLRSVEKIIGYSGEGKPRDSPQNFAIDEASLNATSVIFTWDPVDDSPESIQGHFIGYEVVYWRADQPDDKRRLLVEMNQAVNCRPAEGASRKRRGIHRRQADEVSAHVLDLWPYSDIVAGVSVRNGRSSGELSPTIEFTTPEGAPGPIPMFEVRERGSHHFRVTWAPPLEPNGIITGYLLSWQKLDNLVEAPQAKVIMDPLKRSTQIKGLEESQDYRLNIQAQTGAGYGADMYIEGKTLTAGEPDVPGFADVDVSDTSVNVSWVPTDENETPRNPGSEFYVEYRKADADDDEPWSRSDPADDDQHWANISGLDFGDEYDIRIVAVNGAGQESRSEPRRVQVGVQPERVVSMAQAGWFVGMMCAIAFLLLVLIIVCLIKRNRGGKYPVHEKEKLRARDPDRDDEERGFGEYTKTDEPDYKKSAGSLESEHKPLEESDSDSMAEYEDTDPSKFNEDGSFIGQYGGSSKKTKDKIEPDATSPSALSTFV